MDYPEVLEAIGLASGKVVQIGDTIVLAPQNELLETIDMRLDSRLSEFMAAFVKIHLLACAGCQRFEFVRHSTVFPKARKQGVLSPTASAPDTRLNS